jgi:2-polyprenyl-3-methyl-5-hydroxy-6-metoxy-1,4-benzoquinol methylase
MARFTKLIETLSESFRRGGARSLNYFHTDHFEPWRSMAGRIDISEPNGEDIVDFLEQSAKLEYARRLTLFLKPAFRLAPAGVDVRSVDGDGLGFRPLTDKESEVHDHALRHIAASGHELQVHLHHEYYTKNEMYSTQAKYNRDEYSRQYLLSRTSLSQDEARLRLLAEMTLESYRRGSGKPFDRWFFVHGMWALNGSDRDVCNIDREIGVLQEAGCLGDFTFPAGRPHTDPVHKMPFFCRSVDIPKCYDHESSEPSFAYGSPADGRFFIWASPIKHLFSSIDYYSREIRANLEDIERAAKELVETSVFLDGSLFIKTHAHSMNTDYFDSIRRPIYPHFHPGVQALLGVIFDAAADAGLEVRFPTASEVYDQFTGATFAGSTDIASDANTIRVRQTARETVNAMTPLERLEVFGDQAAQVSHAVVGERLASMGETDSGAYGYYKDLYDRNTLIHPYEFAVAKRLAQTLPDGARIHEFGAGFASLGLLLAVAGFDVLGIDADPRRLATAGAIRAELDRKVPWVAARLNFRNGAIPAVLESIDCGGVTAVATDVTSGASLEELERILAVVGPRYARIVFDNERFFTRTRDAEEMAKVRELFLRHYGACEPITDESVGRFYFEARREPRQMREAPVAAKAERTPTRRRWNGTSPLSFEEATALVDEAGVAVLADAIDGQGLEGSGAGVFYGQILEQGRLAQSYDLKVANWLLENLDPGMPVLEVGAGVGALSLLLALSGRRVVALDLDPKRIALGNQIKERLAELVGHEIDNLEFVRARFPDDSLPLNPADSAVVITNMVFGWDAAQQLAMLRSIGGFQRALVDADRFGVRRSAPGEREAFDALARDAGLEMRVLELVPDARYVELQPESGGGRNRLAPAAAEAGLAG